MVVKKQVAAKKQETGEPKFPYTTEPKSLGRLLTEIPKRPKPLKLTMETLKSWNVSSNNNARTAINVLKKLGLLGPSGEPLDSYVEFMKTGVGPGVLATRIRDVYKVLFENSHAPQNESSDELKKLFHIHSGGGDDVIRLQIQTFKILAEHADFAIGGAGQTGQNLVSPGAPADPIAGHGRHPLPPVQVDLHIHLPENKTTREYEAIIQDIAKYIYGRDVDRS